MNLSEFFRPDALQASLFMALICLAVLPRRKPFGRYIAAGIPFFLICIPLMNGYQRWAIGSHRVSLAERTLRMQAMTAVKSVIQLLLCVAVIWVFLLICTNISRIHALYCASCVYFSQDLAYTLFVFFCLGGAHRSGQSVHPEYLPLELFLLLFCCAGFYLFLAKRILTKANQERLFLRGLAYMLFILIAGKILGTFAALSFNAYASGMFRFLLLYDILLSVSMLIAQFLLCQQAHYQQELAVESRLRSQQYQQYRSQQEAAEHIRHKCHDMKHILSALSLESSSERSKELLKELATSIQEYDLCADTGNETLDAILGAALRSCEQRNIQWTCMADGTALAFLNTFDLYIMLGNALDNAVENVSKVTDPQKRFLSIRVFRRQQLAMIEIENYCDMAPKLVNGIPLTTKKEPQEHGYGMKSILSITEKYGGVLSIHTEDTVFSLSIMLPVPPEQGSASVTKDKQ